MTVEQVLDWEKFIRYKFNSLWYFVAGLIYGVYLIYINFNIKIFTIYTFNIGTVHIFIIIFIIIFLFYRYRYKFINIKEEEVGIFLSVFIDDYKDHDVYRRWFIDELEKEFNKIKEKRIKLVITDYRIAKKLFKKEADFLNFFESTKCVFGAAGNVKKGTNGNYYIEWNFARVKHLKVNNKAKSEIEKIFNNTLIGKFETDSFNYSKTLERVSNNVYITASIMLAISFSIKQEYDLCIELFERSYFDIKKEINYSKIKLEINNLIYNAYIQKSLEFCFKGDTQAFVFLEKAREYKNYSSDLFIVESNLEFILNKDVDKSLELNRRCEREFRSEPTPDFNLIFLYLYKGDYTNSKKQLDKLLRRTNLSKCEMQASQIYKFIEKFINFKDKPVMFFWVGFNLYKITNNKPLAYKYFNDFLENFNEDKELIDTTKKYLQEIKDVINY